MNYELIPEDTIVSIRIHPEGLLQSLAHSLEFRFKTLKATGQLDEENTGTALINANANDLELVGVIENGQINKEKLTQANQEEIKKRIINEAFKRGHDIEIKAMIFRSQTTFNIRMPAGKQVANFGCHLSAPKPGIKVAEGQCDLSLRVLGIPPITGPMSMFKVADELYVHFKATFKQVD